MKWPRNMVLLILGAFIVLLVVMNILGSDRVPEAWHVRNWPVWARVALGVSTVCVFLYALWTDIRDIRDAWRESKDEIDRNKPSA